VLLLIGLKDGYAIQVNPALEHITSPDTFQPILLQVGPGWIALTGISHAACQVKSPQGGLALPVAMKCYSRKACERISISC
jgi:hypothetical protein